MKKSEFKVNSVWWSDEECFYVECLKDDTFYITTLELEDFEKSREELNIEKMKFTYMPDDMANKIAFYALNKYYRQIDKLFNKKLPLIEETDPLLLQIYYSIKSSPQSCWDYSPHDSDKLFRDFRFKTVTNILKDAAKEYKFNDVLNINKKEQMISVYGDFICRFRTQKIINSQNDVNIIINEKSRDELFGTF